MHIALIPLVLFLLSYLFLALGQDPNKRHGLVAGGLVALAVIAAFATQPALLASLGGH